MIETIEGAQAALRKHGEFCQRLACDECDRDADILDVLRVVRRLLDPDVPWSKTWADECRALLARAPTESGGGEVPSMESAQ